MLRSIATGDSWLTDKEAGVLVFQLVEGELPRKARLERRRRPLPGLYQQQGPQCAPDI